MSHPRLLQPPHAALHDLPELIDALIVGAGPAGSVMARQLAAAGISVLLVDKSAFPRSKPCGFCINSTALGALHAVGLGDVVGGVAGASISRFDLRASARRSARLDIEPGCAVDRGAFDAHLAREAQSAGAIFLDGTTATPVALARDAHQIRLQRSAETGSIRARIVIAADGIAGTFLRNETALQPRIHPRSRIGAAVTLPADSSVAFEPGVIWMTCGIGGYLGAVRLKDRRLHLAAALDPAIIRNAGGPGALAARILRGAARDVPEGLEAARWRGTPALSRNRPVEGRRLFIIGDAAGYSEPFTGQGIAWAIISAIAAAPIVRAALAGRDTRGCWQTMHAQCIAAQHRPCQILAWILRHPYLTSRAVELAALAPAISRPVLRVIQHPRLNQPNAGAGAAA